MGMGELVLFLVGWAVLESCNRISTEEEDPNLPKEKEIIHAYAASAEGANNEYTVIKLLGKGGYGAVYEVQRNSDKELFAAKFEKDSARKPTLMMDAKVVRGAQHIKSKHFCNKVDHGSVEGKYKFLIMKLIGRNLWDLRVERDAMRYTLGTALRAAAQCLIALEELHRIGYLHRDVKPGNFAIGRPGAGNKHHIVHLLDFGLCRKFCVVKDKDIRMPRDTAPFRGTTRYAPLAAMKQVDQWRKDDLEGWMYMVAEWTSGALAWRKYRAENREEVRNMKEEVRTNAIRQEQFYANCPRREFQRILQYLDTLSYFSIPDYKFVLKCIDHAMKVNNIKWSDPLDWDPDHPCTYEREEPGDGRNLEMDDSVLAEEKGGSNENTKPSKESVK